MDKMLYSLHIKEMKLEDYKSLQEMNSWIEIPVCSQSAFFLLL